MRRNKENGLYLAVNSNIIIVLQAGFFYDLWIKSLHLDSGFSPEGDGEPVPR